MYCTIHQQSRLLFFRRWLLHELMNFFGRFFINSHNYAT